MGFFDRFKRKKDAGLAEKLDKASTLRRYEKAALKEVNALRKQAGFKPVLFLSQGERAKALSCPIAMSLREGHPHVHSFAYTDANIQIHKNAPLLSEKLSPDARAFVISFDEGKYPELEL